MKVQDLTDLAVQGHWVMVDFRGAERPMSPMYADSVPFPSRHRDENTSSRGSREDSDDIPCVLDIRLTDEISQRVFLTASCIDSCVTRITG